MFCNGGFGGGSSALRFLGGRGGGYSGGGVLGTDDKGTAGGGVHLMRVRINRTWPELIKATVKWL